MALTTNSKREIIIFNFCYVSYVLGLYIFMNGLMSSTVVNLEPSSIETLFEECPIGISKDLCFLQKEVHPSYYYNHYKRTVIILIDALRTDFIPSIKKNPSFNIAMNFTETLINSGSATYFLTQGFAPTVTLPRIKTLVTGTVSNFQDVIINFNAAKLATDNVLTQASRFGLKSVFYGDDTWLKLFPDIFIRSEGTHSFFVTDFKEVDFNVSRHIKSELNNKDWNIMILHFLGVDHIGHAYTPFSHHLPHKLKEMDDVIKFIYDNLKTMQPPSLIIVCGDHGMTTSGSHGGITHDELLTPLIFINTVEPEILPIKDCVIKDQVDFAPTLSSILGIPIPVNNFGKFLSTALEFIGFTPEEILCTAYYNLIQLSRVYNKAFSRQFKNVDLVKETTTAHFKWLKASDNVDYMTVLNLYNMLLDEMKTDLLNTISGYDEFFMILGIIIMWISLFLMFYSLYALNKYKGIVFLQKKNSKFNILLLFMFACFLYYKIYVGILFISLCTLLLLVFYMTCLLFKRKENYIAFSQKLSLTFLFIHALSLFSSSFIEEEHQTWYFLLSTIVVLTCCWRIYHLLNAELRNVDSYSYKFLYDFGLIWNTCSSSVYIMFVLLIIHRIFRKWNQVGNKWQHLPDISDWLNQKENTVFLILSILISQFITIKYFCHKVVGVNYYLFFVGIVCISFQKCSSNFVVHTQLTDYITTMLIPWIVYALITLILFSTFFQTYMCIFTSSIEKVNFVLLNFISAWVLLIEVIGRTVNIPLISVVLIQEHLMSRILWIPDIDFIINMICYLIMAKSSFYYYGNSNSLSTIDVFTGYTGIQSYMPTVVVLLLISNTYSTVLMWLIMFAYRIVNFHAGNFEIIRKRIKFAFLFFLEYKLSILALYSIVMFLMRHHLFIFSVFFPKFFYELSNVILFSVIYLVIFIISRD